jgi:hypothetical protein
MESLQLKIDNRPNLYWNRFQYRARVRIDGLRMAYGARSIEDVVNNLEYSKSWGRRLPVIDYISLEKWLSYKILHKDKLLVRIEGDVAGVFSNDLECLKNIESYGIVPLDYTQACSDEPNGVMYFKNEPKFKYRSYMRARRIDDGTKQEIKEFIQRYNLKPCNALESWLDGSKYKFVSSYIPNTYSISYDDDKIPMLMSMILPGIFNKHYKLEKRP